MKYVKMLGLLAVAAAALMAFAGSASATVTYNGSAYTGSIAATSSNSELDGTVDIKCKHSTVAGRTENGATTSAIETLTFTECGSDTVVPITNAGGNYGALEIDSSGTVYAENVEVTVLTHRELFGSKITTHCIYDTGSNLDIGTLTEGTDTINLTGTNIPKLKTDDLCGENSQWTGSYTITTPGALSVH